MTKPEETDPTSDNKDSESTDSKGEITVHESAAKPDASQGSPNVPATLAPPATDDAPSARVGFLTMLVGGFIAGAIGYLLAFYTEFGLFQTSEIDEIAALSEELAAQSQTLDSQAAQIADLQAEPDVPAVDLTGLEGRIAALEGTLESLETASADPAPVEAAPQVVVDPGVSPEEVDALRAELEARLAELEGQIAAASDGPSQEDVTALEGRLTALTDEIAAQEGLISQAAQAAQDETRRVSANAALSEIDAAVEAGQPFQDAIGAFQSTSDIAVPEALSTTALDGVATLAELQSSFPAAARDGLDASLSETAGDGTGSRLLAFVRSQTGARSLQERDGNDPDAVLSRAEARLRDGEVSGTLTQLQDLPEGGRAAMSDWIAAAQARVAAQAAVVTLDQSVNSN